jgi:hypothetical protein
MNLQNSAVNKISPITVHHVLARERLFALLRQDSPINAFWIAGPTAFLDSSGRRIAADDAGRLFRLTKGWIAGAILWLMDHTAKGHPSALPQFWNGRAGPRKRSVSIL